MSNFYLLTSVHLLSFSPIIIIFPLFLIHTPIKRLFFFLTAFSSLRNIKHYLLTTLDLPLALLPKLTTNWLCPTLSSPALRSLFKYGLIYEYPCVIEDIISWTFCTGHFIIAWVFPHANRSCIHKSADWGVAASIPCWNEEINLWELSTGNQATVNQLMATFHVSLLSASLHERVWNNVTSCIWGRRQLKQEEKVKVISQKSIFSFTMCAFKINQVW